MSKQTITVIKGDGIGPSIVEAAIQVLDKVGCEFEYEYVDAGLTALEKNRRVAATSYIRCNCPQQDHVKRPSHHTCW